MTRRATGRRGSQRAATRQPGGARRLAFDVLTAWQQRQAFAGRVLEDLCRDREIHGADRALALDISFNVIRRQATIDAILTSFVDRPRSEIEAGMWTLLQIGVCQLVLLDRIPPHAAVDETAQLTKEIRRPQWTRTVNGVLRAVAKSMSGDLSGVPATCRVPVGRDGFRNLDRAVFADPEAEPVDYLVKAFSFPRWLIRDWLDRWDIEETTRLCRWFNVPPIQAIRVNVLQQQPAVVGEALAGAGVTTKPGQFPESLRTDSTLNPSQLPGFALGWFSIQDESAMAAARLLNPRPGDRVLDLCAAPGGKSAHLAELMHDRGTVVAVDVDASRLERVCETAKRLRLTSIETCLASPAGDGIPDGPFDAAVVDVPCSNTGVLGKRPEARWRISPESLHERATLQLRLLSLAVGRIRPGGSIVYSTCSIDSRENRSVVDAALAVHPDLIFERDVVHSPGKPSDGGYQALLRRR